MRLRVGVYNINNLFARAALFELEGFSGVAREVLDDIEALCVLLEQASYAGAEIVRLLEKYGFHTGRLVPNPWFAIVEARGELFGVRRDRAASR